MNFVELLINNPPTAKLDLDSQFNIGLQYSIADIRNISKRNAAYSKTIILPGTKNNNFWLGNLFDVNTDFTAFNPNKKTEAKLTVNSETVIDGFLQLRKINKLNNVDAQGNKIQYEVVIYNNAVDLMTELGQKTINQLDLSEYGHVFSIDAITQSWDNTYEEGYVYPMYGLENTDNQYNAEWFWPSMFYWTLLDRTLYEAGFGWTGSLKTDPQFQNEILAYVSDGRPKIEEDERRRRLFEVGYTVSTIQDIGTFSGGQHNQFNSSQYSYLAEDVLELNDDFTAPLFDNDNNWDLTLYEWTVDANGLYSCEFNFEGAMDIFNNSGTASVIQTYPGESDANPFIQYRSKFKIEIERNTGTIINWPGTMFIEGPIHKWQAQNTIFGSPVEVDGFTISNGQSFLLNSGQSGNNPAGFGPTFSVAITGPQTSLSIGDKVRIKASIGRRAPYTWPNEARHYWSEDMNMRLSISTNTSFKNTSYTAELTQGDYLNLGAYLPDKIKQKDLITDLISRYNLYISVDPDNDRLLIMDSRPDYYDAGGILDWTNKKDFSSEDNIQILAELQFKEMLFTWALDDDDNNKAYEVTTGDIYGQYKYIFDNDFVKGEKQIKSPFAATPIIYNDTQSINPIGAHLPAIDPEAPKIKPRVLYYGGLKDAEYGWNIIYQDITTGLANTWYNTNISGKYPYAGHFDDPIQPTIDINFGTCKYYFYNNYDYLTNNNMYNRYWSNYISQIEEGRLVTSKFDLDEYDIRFIKENFNTKIFVLDSYYYVNKIIDYNPLENKVTTVELIKIVEGLAWEGQEITTGPGLTAIGPLPPTYEPDTPVGNPGPVRPVRPVRPIKDWGFNNGFGPGGVVIGGSDNEGGGWKWINRVETEWILDCGYWDDEGIWIDDDIWKDSTKQAGCGVVYKTANRQFFFGNDNTLLGANTYVYGDRNTIESDNSSVFNGSDNYISSEANNVTLIQSQGLTVSTSNTVYLGNSFSVNTLTGQVNLDGKLGLTYGTSEDPSLQWYDGFQCGFWKAEGERQFNAGVQGITISTWDSKGINMNDKTIEEHRFNWRRAINSTTVTDIDYVIELGGTNTGITVSLPADSNSGRFLYIKNLMASNIDIGVETNYTITGSSKVIDNFINNGGSLQIDTNLAHGYATGSYVYVSGSGQYSGPYQITSIDSTLLFTVNTSYIAGPAGGETVAEVTYETIDGTYTSVVLSQYDSLTLCSKSSGNWIII